MVTEREEEKRVEIEGEGLRGQTGILPIILSGCFYQTNHERPKIDEKTQKRLKTKVAKHQVHVQTVE